MKVLMIGGTGLISTATSKLALKMGIELYLINRGNKSHSEFNGAHIIKADINDTKTVLKAIEGLHFDSVVDWTVFTPEQAKRDYELFNGRTNQFIFISTASVYQKPVSHYIITESTPLINPYWEYSRKKIECEDYFMKQYRENGFPITIVRPSLTYGDSMIYFSTNSWSHPWTIIDRIKKGKKIVVHGDGTSLWSMTHNTDFAKGMVGLFGKLQTLGHAFHITTDEVLSWNQILEIIAKTVGIEPKVVHVSSDFIAEFIPGARGDLLGDKAVSIVYDNTKIKRFVPGFTATTSFEEGVAKAYKWFEEHPEACTIDDELNEQLDRIIDAYEAGIGMAKK